MPPLALAVGRRSDDGRTWFTALHEMTHSAVANQTRVLDQLLDLHRGSIAAVPHLPRSLQPPRVDRRTHRHPRAALRPGAQHTAAILPVCHARLEGPQEHSKVLILSDCGGIGQSTSASADCWRIVICRFGCWSCVSRSSLRDGSALVQSVLVGCGRTWCVARCLAHGVLPAVWRDQRIGLVMLSRAS